MGTVDIRAVTPGSLVDLDALFSSRGAPGYCWCTVFRSVPGGATDKESRRTEMLGRVRSGEPVGLLAYVDGEPVGWCSVAPRPTYTRLGGASYDDVPEDEVWSVVCFFVARSHRGRGLQTALLEGAVERARSGGARVLEAYPVQPDAPSYRFGGFVPLFERLGFSFQKMAGTRRHVMSLRL